MYNAALQQACLCQDAICQFCDVTNVCNLLPKGISNYKTLVIFAVLTMLGGIDAKVEQPKTSLMNISLQHLPIQR